MSILSDVGVALKHKVFESLSPESMNFLSTADEKHVDRQKGMLFVFYNVKWNDHIPDVSSFLEDLSSYGDEFAYSEEDFLIVEACHDFPSHENTEGEWEDNPWNLCLNLSVSLSYE